MIEDKNAEIKKLTESGKEGGDSQVSKEVSFYKALTP